MTSITNAITNFGTVSVNMVMEELSRSATVNNSMHGCDEEHAEEPPVRIILLMAMLTGLMMCGRIREGRGPWSRLLYGTIEIMIIILIRY